MSYQSWQEYVRTQRGRYQRASRLEKGRILTEGCALFGVHRKSLVRAFARAGHGPKARRGSKPRYGLAELRVLKRIWLASGQPCSKRLKAVLALWLPACERREGPVEPETRRNLLAMSASTMDRLLRPIRARRRRGLSATGRAPRLEGQIPIRTRFQEVEGPGWVEADTVAHCGTSLAGRFVWSLTLTDIFSGWTESRAVWNRQSHQVVRRVGEIETALPFDLEGFDSDNGSEFMNHELLRYLRQRPAPVDFTRSRPYRKNDNAHVEQKQWTHVRQLLGYDRFEDRRLVRMINDLYAGPWRLLVNFFQPSMQLLSKGRENGHLYRRHSKPRTPCQRLLDCPLIAGKTKDRLREQQETLDPFELHEEVETRLRAIFRLVREKGHHTTIKAKAA